MTQQLYLVEDQQDGVTNLVFTWENPSQSGFQGNVIPGVTLDYDMLAVHRWDDGEDAPEVCVGRDPDNPTHYKVFKYPSAMRAAGFELVAGSPVVFGRWKDYLKLRRAADLPEEDWFEELDRINEVSRQRSQRTEVQSGPARDNRDEVAQWVAKKHLIADSGIREVWYLPRESPPNEIRLLELNDQLAGDADDAEAIDFGLDVEGAKFRLLVADVTSEQLERIKSDPTRLPDGWSLDGFQRWRRGA